MVPNNDKNSIIEEKLDEYKKAISTLEYQRVFSVLNKYHEKRIENALWEGLRSKEKEKFPLVAFFATVSALESYGKNNEVLEIFIRRWKNDYEDGIVSSLTLHRLIEVVHIIINEAFQSYRNDANLNDTLLQSLEKKTLLKNSDGIYKTIDAFKFFPKKLGKNIPKRLMDGFDNIIANYYRQQILEGKNNKELLDYIDFFTDKIGMEKALALSKKAELICKSELFCTFPGQYTTDIEKGKVYIKTAVPFNYSEEFITKELVINGIEKIVHRLGGKTSNLLLNLETDNIIRDITSQGTKKFLTNKSVFKLPSQAVKEVLEKLPPIIPAFVIKDDDQIIETINARYARNYFELDHTVFMIFGHQEDEDFKKLDMIDGVIIELANNDKVLHKKTFTNSELESLFAHLDMIVSEIAVEIKKLNVEKENFIEELIKKEDEIDKNPFLGFKGEKERKTEKDSLQEKRKEYKNRKEKEIISAFSFSIKKKAIEVMDNINSLSALEHLCNSNSINDQLSQIKGHLTLPVEIIKQAMQGLAK